MKKKILIMAMLMTSTLLLVGCQSSDYNNAEKLLSEGKYDEAIVAFQTLGDYKDSIDKVTATKYAKGESLYDDGEYEEAIEIFEAIKDYNDSEELIDSCHYKLAEDMIKADKYVDAISELKRIPDYKDSKTKIKETAYLILRSKVEKEGKSYSNTDDSFVLGRLVDKAYTVSINDDNCVFVGLKGDSLVVGQLYETLTSGLYSCAGISVGLDSEKEENDFMAIVGLVISLLGKKSTTVSVGTGVVEMTSVTMGNPPKVTKIESGSDSAFDIEQENVNNYWRDFCNQMPKLLDEMGLTLNDLGFEKF